MWAVQEGYFGIVELLLQRGSSVNIQKNDGATPLFLGTAPASPQFHFRPVLFRLHVDRPNFFICSSSCCWLPVSLFVRCSGSQWRYADGVSAPGLRRTQRDPQRPGRDAAHGGTTDRPTRHRPPAPRPTTFLPRRPAVAGAATNQAPPNEDHIHSVQTRGPRADEVGVAPSLCDDDKQVGHAIGGLTQQGVCGLKVRTTKRLELAAVGDDALLPGGVISVNGLRLDLPD